MPIKENKIILDRDEHFIGVMKKEDGLLLAHRRFEDRDLPDKDDVFLSREQARSFLEKLKHLLGIEPSNDVITVNLSEDKTEVCIYPETASWIGLGLKETRILVEQLEEKLNAEEK